jgi:rhodanese-related sulfurtransferase
MIKAIKRILGLEPKVDYASLVKHGAIILDVRSKGEYSGGHIKGSMNIPVDSLASNLSKLKNKSTPIITCCASGMRSGQALTILKANGFERVYNGGSWSSLGRRLN